MDSEKAARVLAETGLAQELGRVTELTGTVEELRARNERDAEAHSSSIKDLKAQSQEEKRSLQDEVQLVRASLDGFERTHDALIEQLNLDHDAETHKLSGTIADLRQQKLDLVGSHEEAMRSKDSATGDMMAKHRRTIQDLQAAHEVEMKSKGAEVEEWQMKYRDERRSSDIEMAKLKFQRDSIETIAADRERLIADLDNMITVRDATIVGLREDIAYKESIVLDQKARNNENAATIARHENTITNLRSQVAVLTQTVGSKDEKMNSLEDAHQVELEKEEALTRSKLDEYEEYFNGLADEATRKHNQQLASLHSELEKKDRQHNQQIAKLKSLAEETERKHSKEIAELRSKVARYNNEMNEQRNWFAAQANSDAVTMINNSLEIQKLSTKIQDITSSYEAKMKEQDTAHQAAMTESNEKIAELASQVAQHATALDNSRLSYDDAMRRKDEDVVVQHKKIADLENVVAQQVTVLGDAEANHDQALHAKDEILHARNETIAKLEAQLAKDAATLEIAGAEHAKSLQVKEDDLQALQLKFSRYEDTVRSLAESLANTKHSMQKKMESRTHDHEVNMQHEKAEHAAIMEQKEVELAELRKELEEKATDGSKHAALEREVQRL